MMRRLVVIPTYNEAGNIKSLIELLFTSIPECEVMVVDDGSPDGTALIVKAMKDENKRLHLIDRPQKNGIGSAYRMAFFGRLSKVLTMSSRWMQMVLIKFPTFFE